MTRGSGPQQSARRLPGSGQVQCTSWRNLASFSCSTFKTIHGEQACKRDRGGSAVGARHIVREQATTQTVYPVSLVTPKNLPPGGRRPCGQSFNYPRSSLYQPHSGSTRTKASSTKNTFVMFDDSWILFVNDKWPNPHAQDKWGELSISPSTVCDRYNIPSPRFLVVLIAEEGVWRKWLKSWGSVSQTSSSSS